MMMNYMEYIPGAPFSPSLPFVPSRPGIPQKNKDVIWKFWFSKIQQLLTGSPSRPASPFAPSNPGNPGKPTNPISPSCPCKPTNCEQYVLKQSSQTLTK